jgi:hypothetical protein
MVASMLRLASLLLALAAIAAGALVLAATDGRAARDPLIAPGTRIAGLEIGGQTAAQVVPHVEAAFGRHLRAPVEVRVGSHRLHLTARFARLRFDAARSVQRAAQNGPGDVAPWVGYDARRVSAFVDRVARAIARKPRDAALRYTVTRLKVRHARAGYDIDRDALLRRVEAVLADPRAARILRAPVVRTQPELTAAELAERYPTVVTIHRRGFRLRLFRHLEPVASYPVAVGMPAHPTPRGRFKIANKAVDPAWSAPDKPWAGAYRNEVVAGGTAENPLKARWLGIVNGVGIHGTDATWSLGSRASHGCIRMSVRDVKRLYARVPVGALVMIK